MEKLFTKQQQAQQYEKACDAFTNGDYKAAEPIFRLVIESAYQHNDMDLYVTSMVSLERILINTSRMQELLPYITLLNPLITHYGDEHAKYRHELSVIIFNHFYRIEEPIQALKQLLEKVARTPHIDLICAVANNLMHQYIETKQHEEGLKVFDQIRSFYDEGIASANNLLDIKFELDIFIAALKEQRGRLVIA